MSIESARIRAKDAGVSFPVFAVDDPAEAAGAVAAEIASLIESAARDGSALTLGFATGRTPRALYRELVRLHAEAGLSFRLVTSFNLDEYLGLAPGHSASFREVMRGALFDRVDLAPERTHLPDGSVSPAEVAASCASYEREIQAAGGIDLQVLGLGPNGHLAFNEPGSARESRTRRVRLTERTRRANRAAFATGESVPDYAITMGVGTILEARRLRVMAFGEGKAEIVARALREPIGPELPATFLREHDDVELWLDRDAAANL